ncbi:LCP family protein [Myxacorys almedinensis]|uniref:LCP family protein n=1 Tax=Myxacorys almedinensis TaxID=2651157 RepID=UPI00192F0E26|nr:LCP family protein [Myxacorys almedinensis]
MKNQSTLKQPELGNPSGATRSHPSDLSAPSLKRKSSARSLLWAITFLATAGISATLGTTLALIAPIPGAVAPSEGQKLFGDLWSSGFQYRVSRPVNILVMGIDGVPDAPVGSDEMFAGRSDTLLVIHVDPTDRSVKLLSVPRDTQVEVPGIGITKINQANESGGPLLAREAVSQTLNGIEIDRYVRVSTDAFRELVNLLGGVQVYVPEPMQYTDNTQKLKIDLTQGWQTLNGDQAEQFARFRQDNYGDIGRVQRQQVLIKALREKLTSPLVVPRIPSLIGMMQKYIDTNLSVEEMLSLLNLGLKLDKDDFKMVMLPGRFSAPDEFKASYWIMDPQGRDRVVQDFLTPSSTRLSSELPSTDLKIAVQNASVEGEAADQVIRHLSSLGYTNVYLTRDWSEGQQKTQVIVQRGDVQAAKALQSALGFGTIEASSTGDLDSDLTIRVGDDWLTQQHLNAYP